MKRVEVSWLNEEQDILLFRFEHGFTVEEYQAASEGSRELVKLANPELFFVIADVTTLFTVPTRMIFAMKEVYRKPEPNFAGVTIVIGTSPFIRHLIGIFGSSFTGNHFYAVDDISAAHQLVTKLKQKAS